MDALPDILEENNKKLMQKSSAPAEGGKLKRSLSFKSKLKQKSLELFGTKKRCPSSPCLVSLDDDLVLNSEVSNAAAYFTISAGPVSPPIKEQKQSRKNKLFSSKHSSLNSSDSVHHDPDFSRSEPTTAEGSGSASSFERGIRRTRSLPSRRRSQGNIIRQHIIRSRYSQHEFLYRKVLQAIQHPLGHIESRPGFRPSELMKEIQQVFDIDPEVHEECFKDVINASPSRITVSGCLLEAKSLQPGPQNGLRDAYCVIGLAGVKTPFGSPNNSPHGSPRASPTRFLRRKYSTEQSAVFRSKVIKHTLFPKWNESFELDIGDLDNEELNIVVCDDASRDVNDSAGSTETLEELRSNAKKSHGINRLVQHLKSMVDLDKCGNDVIGQIRIPLRDIPNDGWDQWFEISKGKKSRKCGVTGHLRLKLQVSAKHADCNGSSEANELCNAEDFGSFLKKLYSGTFKLKKERNDNVRVSSVASLSEQSRVIMCQFATWNGLPPVTQTVVELSVLLEMAVETNEVSEHMIQAILEKLDKDWSDELNCKVTLLGLNTSLRQFETSAYKYIHHLTENLKSTVNFPPLFPPRDLQLELLTKRLGLAMNLVNMPMWTNSQDAQREFSTFLAQRLRDDAQQWIQAKLNSIKPEGRDAVLSECKQFVDILEQTLAVIIPIFSVTELFKRVGFDYYKLAMNAMESMLSLKAQELMLRIDQYQLRYHRDHVNIRESSHISNKVYCGLRSFLNVIKESFTEKEFFRISMSKYQNWFSNSVIFWLQTYRDECIQRMQRALVLEKDVVQVTSLVKYSESSVLVKSTFAKITKEWCDIDFNDADIALLGVTKITDTICDGARQYADTVSSILEKKGYYDDNDNQQFDVTDQLCISLNNIENVRQYLVQLPKLLKWDDVIHKVIETHETTRVGEKARKTLDQLVQSADTDIMMRCHQIWGNIIDMMFIDLVKYTTEFTQDAPTKKSSVDKIMEYLRSNLQVLCDKLEQTMVPLVLEQVWERELRALESTLLPGQSPDYYVRIQEHLQSIQECVQQDYLSDDTLQTAAYISMIDRLQMNSLSTEQLALKYYGHLAVNEATPLLSYGQLVVKAGYRENPTDGTVKLVVKVVRAQNLPGVNRKETCDPYVIIYLAPDLMFPFVRPQHTCVAKGEVSPEYHEMFEFINLPRTAFKMEGAVLVCSVWNHDRFLPNDFLGEIMICLNDVDSLRRSIDDMPALIMSLRRPRDVNWGPMQVLMERQNIDSDARQIILRRHEMAGLTVRNKMCSPLTRVISKVKGKREVVGKSRGIVFEQ